MCVAFNPSGHASLGPLPEPSCGPNTFNGRSTAIELIGENGRRHPRLEPPSAPWFNGWMQLTICARKPSSRLVVLSVLAAVYWLGHGACAAEVTSAAAVAANTKVAPEGPWVFAYFRQRYEGRVEIDAQGRARQVPLPNPMKEERLHLALSTDGRHWTPLNGNRPVWDHERGRGNRWQGGQGN